MAIVHNILIKIKHFRDILVRRDDIFIVLIIVFVGVASFALGRLSALEKGSFELTGGPVEGLEAQISSYGDVFDGLEEGRYVASKYGTKYHAPWCSGAVRIKEENKIWFASKEDAEKAGYEPASNCKGL